MNENQETENQATATPATAAPAAVTPKDIANGVTRPKAGTLTARIWTVCDTLSGAANAPAERAKVIKACVAEGINAATAATQHGKWRKYHGLVADTPEAKVEAAAATKVKAEKEAAAAAKKEAAAKVKAAKAAAKAAAETATSDDIVVEDGAAVGSVE